MSAKYRLQLKIDRICPPKIGATSSEETTESQTEITVLLYNSTIDRGDRDGVFDHLFPDKRTWMRIVSDGQQHIGVGTDDHQACLDWLNRYYGTPDS